MLLGSRCLAGCKVTGRRRSLAREPAASAPAPALLTNHPMCECAGWAAATGQDFESNHALDSIDCEGCVGEMYCPALLAQHGRLPGGCVGRPLRPPDAPPAAA